MKEQFAMVVLRRKFVAGDSGEARKTATGHSCKPLCVILPQPQEYYDKNRININGTSKTKND